MKISRRSFLKSTAAAAALAAVGSTAVQAEETAEAAFSYAYEGEVPAADAYPITPEEFGSGEVKYTIEETEDGWIKVINEGGATLGYSKKSGLQLIQVDGYAFKDMNGDGMLDLYEDWRQAVNDRAADLASKMSGEEIAPLLTHGGWSVFASKVDDDEYLHKGGRAGVTRSANVSGNQETAVKWINALQAYCEENGGYGIPATVSVDPSNIDGTIDQNALAATMNVELAKKIGQENAKDYRRVGITMLLGPQIDIITNTVWTRGTGSYSEDPALNRDLAKAFIGGLQSTWDADGNDLGWGNESVYAIAKHYCGAGATEGGRNDHNDSGKYCVFPGDNFAAHMIPFVDGAFNLDTATGFSGVMPCYGISYSEDGSLGENVASAYSEYKIGLLRENGYDGFILTDWQVSCDPDYMYGSRAFGDGLADLTEAERLAWMFEIGVDQIGGTDNQEAAAESWNVVVDDLGEEEALANFREHARRFFVAQMDCGLFECPYISSEGIKDMWTEESGAFGDETSLQAIVMIKNKDNVIAPAVEGEMKTLYIPQSYSEASVGWCGTTPAGFSAAIDTEAAAKYFNVITDTVLDPSGEADEDGNATYTADDVEKADASAADIIIVKMSNPDQDSSVDDDGQYYPPNLQYEEYTATTAHEAIAGDVEMVAVPDGYYGTTYREEREDRSYVGMTTGRSSNYSCLENLKSIYETKSENTKIVAFMDISSGPSACIWSEFEAMCDAILYVPAGSSYSDDTILQIVSGQVEPSALLPIQQPASMEAVEAQLEDVPRDVEVYVDSEGNAYDFAFGLNWSGVIDDERVQTYSVPAVTMPETIEFHYAE